MHETVLQPIAKKGDTLGIRRERPARNFRGFAEAHDAGDVFRAGSETALVVSAIEKLTQTSSTADVKGADPLWRIQFVAGDREQIHLERTDVNGDFACGLHGIGVEIDVGFGGDAADFLEGLDGAELVVGVHDGDEQGLRPDGAAKFVEIN